MRILKDGCLLTLDGSYEVASQAIRVRLKAFQIWHKAGMQAASCRSARVFDPSVLAPPSHRAEGAQEEHEQALVLRRGGDLTLVIAVKIPERNRVITLFPFCFQSLGSILST